VELRNRLAGKIHEIEELVSGHELVDPIDLTLREREALFPDHEAQEPHRDNQRDHRQEHDLVAQLHGRSLLKKFSHDIGTSTQAGRFRGPSGGASPISCDFHQLWTWRAAARAGAADVGRGCWAVSSLSGCTRIATSHASHAS